MTAVRELVPAPAPSLPAGPGGVRSLLPSTAPTRTSRARSELANICGQNSRTKSASSGAAGTAALALVLAGTVMLLGGLLFAARSIIISTDAIDYEVQRTLSLGS